MILDSNVLRPRSHPRDVGLGKSAHVVFEDGRVSSNLKLLLKSQGYSHLLSQLANRQEFTHRLAQGNVFSLYRAQGDFGLKLGSLGQGTVADADDESGT